MPFELVNRPLRRLLIVTDCAHGGTFHVATLLAEGLRDAFTVSFVAPFGSESAATHLGDLGIDVHASALGFENLMRSSYALTEAADLLDATRPDLILSVDGAELSSLLSIKTIANRRSIPYAAVINLLSEDVIERFASLIHDSKAALVDAAAVVFVSAASRGRCERLLPDVRMNAHVIPNSCPDAFFAPTDQAVRDNRRQSLGVAENEILCLTTARIEDRKGQAHGVAALGRLKAEGRLEGFRWILAGRAEPWDRNKLEAAMEAAGVAERMSILGERDDVLDLLDAADVFVLTSYAEGMPLCIIEALAKGVPVVATAIDGIVEQLDESCGILLPPATEKTACVEALANGLDLLEKDRSQLASMGDAARRRARSHYHSSIGLSRYRALLTKIADEHPVRITDADDEPDPRLLPGVTLDFAEPSRIWNFLQDGWAACERHGIWTDGTSSTLRLRLNASVTEIRLRFEISPFEKRVESRATTVFANDVRIGTWWTRRGRQSVSLDIDTRKTGSDLLLRFENPGATRPCDIGAGDDYRQLALFFHHMDLIEHGSPTFRAMLMDRFQAWISRWW